MRDLNYRLWQLCQRNRDGSFATRARRARELDLCARQLHELGYTRFRDPHKLKGRHVAALVARWQEEGLSAGTIKARMASLRWWAEKVGRESVIDPRNAAYGIAERRYVTNESKAVFLAYGDLGKVRDVRLRASLELQRAFGLRQGRMPEVPAAFSRQGGQAGAQAVLVQGRAGAGNSYPHGAAAGSVGPSSHRVYCGK